MKVKLINEPITSDYGKNLLRARGVEDVDLFLNPDSSCIQSCWYLSNMKEAVDLISNLSSISRVAMVADCDVDGYTSAAIIYQYLLRYLPELGIDVYLHRGKAHGLEEHWHIIEDYGAYDLIVLPDAGSNDKQYAEKMNCPVLILDHHLVDGDEDFSSNMVVVNNQLSPLYKNKSLSGAGVAYQFCRAMDETFGKNWADDYLDLAALGIAGDMMNGLEIENQYIWKKGFSQINNYFFLTLARKQAYSITGKVGVSDNEIIKALNPTSVAFYIVPLINAMIRVGTEEEKMRLWIAFVNGHQLVESHKRGAKGTQEEVAVESARECTNARSHQNKFLDSTTAILEQKIFKHDLLENKILFIRLDDEDFPSELNGSTISAL